MKMILAQPKIIKIHENKTFRKTKPLIVKSSIDYNFIETSVKITGKIIGTFVLMYTSLNWLNYRDLRKKIEDKDDKS